MTTVALLAVYANAASAATVPLNGRTFDAACKASNAGDVVTVPAGSYGSQNISCTKSVTLLAQGTVTLQSLGFSGANGPTVDGVRVIGSSDNGAASVMKSQNVTIRNTTFNNMVYLEGAVDTLFDHDTWEPADSSTAWSNGDMMDLYEQTRTPTPNTRVTVQDSVFHGLRAPNSAAHSDAIQICNCASSDAQHTIDFKILRTKFYDNECMNVRTNPQDQVTLENNLIGDTVRGISGCGDYSLDVLAANATVRYNTFYGQQRVQVNATADVGQSQTWVGNAGVGMSTSCGAIRGTYAYNVWTSQKCGTTDKQVASLKLNADGTPQSGSPVIDAGNPSSFPGTDYNGASRPVGAAPDAGAFEFGGTTGMPDTTPPETTITSPPSDSSATSASLSFISSESNSSFECRLDGGVWGSCVSPKTFTGLAVGSHTVEVRATDAAGNTDASPATTTWTVTSAPSDTTPPETTISSAPADGTSTSASIAFVSSEAGSTFECRLDGGAFAACTSPKAYSGLSVGTHTFDVRATDAAGNTDATPATASWTISAGTPTDTTPPDTTITSPPSNGTSTSASIAFTSTESGSTFQCRLDSGSYAACTSPKTYSGLSVGSHTFRVRATDAAGNTDPSSASATWTISAPSDTTAPNTTITTAPQDGEATSASVAFASSESNSTFQCKLDAGSYAACTSPKAYNDLAVGDHTVSVRATDAAGNTDASPATATWTVIAPDTTPPSVAFTQKPSVVSPSISTSATFAFAGSDDRTAAAALTFTCSLDHATAAACDSPTTVTGLGLGSHTFSVWAKDAAGNQSDAATTTWTVIPLVSETPVPPSDPTPPSAPAPPTTPAPLVPPTVSLLKPVGGTTFRTSLTAKAAADDDSKVDHVEFWLDAKRFGYDRAAPYTAKATTTTIRSGVHTLVARAVDDQGLASTVATTVTRVSGATASATATPTQAASASTDDGTSLLTTGAKNDTVTVGFAACSDSKAKVVRKIQVKLGKAGKSGTSVAAGRLCIVSVRAA